MMRALILLLAMRAALAFDCSPCECHKSDRDDVVICEHAAMQVTIKEQIYMDVECKRKYLTCADLPNFNYGKNQTLRTLNVTSCPSHFLRCVEQLQATGVSSLYLEVSGQLTVDDVAKLGSVKDIILMYFDDAVTKIPVALSKLPNLRNLTIYGMSLRPSSQEVWSTQIPADAFNGLSKLTALKLLWTQKLGAIGVNSFRGLDSLVKLFLGTKIPSLSPGCFSHTPQLRSVLAVGNALQELPAGVLYNLTQLEIISFDENAVEFKLQPKSLSQLPSLKYLLLKHMKIKDLSDDLLTGNTALQKLSLQANDIATLPVKIFKDLQSLVDLDLSFNKIKKVESGLFSQLKQLIYLNLNHNSLQILPEYLFLGLKNLKMVEIEHNFLHTISPCAFQGAGIHTLSLVDNQLPLAAHDQITLKANAVELKLQPKSLSQLPSLKYLLLEYMKIKVLSDDLFTGNTALRKLSLKANYIATLPVKIFEDLHSLVYLDLSFNKIKKVESGLFLQLKNLVYLDLNSNSLQILPDYLFSGLTNLKAVKIEHNFLHTISPSAFQGASMHILSLADNHLTLAAHDQITLGANAVEFKLQPNSLSQLPSSKNLHLEHMKMKVLRDDLVTGNTSSQKLSLKVNDIATQPVTIFKDLHSLMFLDLSSNKIKKVESGLFLQLKQLKYLNLNRNSLQILPDYLFSGLTNLETVTIEHNFLHTISPSAFQEVRIHTLSLAENHLTLEDHNQLNDTHLSHNRISVNLRFNNITSLNMSLLEQFLKRNFTLDLRDNHISSITLNYPKQSPEDQPLDNSSLNAPNSIIYIENNPLYCDCGLYYSLSKIKRKGQKRVKSLISEPIFVVGDARCESPEKLKGKLFRAVSHKDFDICYLPEEDCPDDCSCEFEPPTNNLDLKCFNAPANLPVPETFGAKYLSLKLLESPQSLNSLSVDLLNLTGIGLKDIPFAPSQNVTRIDFSNNNLTTVPTEFLSANTILYLAKNPFICDCGHSNEIAILKISNLINDSEYLTCSDGRNLYEIDISTLCSVYNAVITATEILVVLLIIATILSIAIYRNKHEVFILLSRIFPCIFTDDLTDSDKEYDLFISYAHRDLEYFRKLLPRLENDFKQKTCLHYRDWSIGDLIPEQINRSVQQSRRTVILLSKNFLESTYANMEFREAHNYALKEGKTRVILILLEDVTDYECLSEELKAYIKTNTYLSWDDPKFWERLQKALPRKNAKKFIWPEIFKRRVNQGLDVPLDTLTDTMKLEDAALGAGHTQET